MHILNNLMMIFGTVLFCVVLFYLLKKKIKDTMKLHFNQCSVVVIENKTKYVIHPVSNVLKVLKCYKSTSNDYNGDCEIVNDFEMVVSDVTHVCTINVNVTKPGVYRIGTTPIKFKVFEERSDFKDTVIKIPNGTDYLDVKSLLNVSDKVDDIIETFDDFNKSNNQGIFLVKEYDLIIERILKSKDIVTYKKIEIDHVIRVTSKNLVNGRPLKIFTTTSFATTFVDNFEKFMTMDLTNEDFIKLIGRDLRLHDHVNMLSDESCKHILENEPIVIFEKLNESVSYIGDSRTNYYLMYMTSQIDKVDKMINNQSVKNIIVHPVTL